MECLFGATTIPPSGRVALHGRPVHFRHPAEAMRAGIGLVTEDRKRLGVFAQTSVGHNVTLCTLDQAVQGGMIRPRVENAMALEAVEQLAIKAAGPTASSDTLPEAVRV